MPIHPADIIGAAKRLVLVAEELDEDEVVIPTVWARLLLELAKQAKTPRRALLEANRWAKIPEKVSQRGRLPMSTRAEVRKKTIEFRKRMVLKRGRAMRAELRKQGFSGTEATNRTVPKIRPELERLSKSRKGLKDQSIKRMLETRISDK